MSKFTLGQHQFLTLGLRNQQPKNYVGPTLSCYLGRTMVFVVIFLIYYFLLFVPIFDLVHAVDAILIPLKQLRASQNRL